MEPGKDRLVMEPLEMSIAMQSQALLCKHFLRTEFLNLGTKGIWDQITLGAGDGGGTVLCIIECLATPLAFTC